MGDEHKSGQYKLMVHVMEGGRPMTLYADIRLFKKNTGGFSYSLAPEIIDKKKHIIKDFCNHCFILFCGAHGPGPAGYPLVTPAGDKVIYSPSELDTQSE